MSIDTSVLVRVRNRPLFRRLIEAWAGERPLPTLWPLEDDSVLVGTTIRWDSRGMELEARELLAALTAGRLGEIHDDPRGVYLCTDMALPRRRTYEGAVAELGGRFIDPAPPTADELGARKAASDVAVDRVTVLYEAVLEGDIDAFVRGLVGASEWQRGFMIHAWGERHPDRPLPEIPPAAAPPPQPLPLVAPAPLVSAFVPALAAGAVSVLLPARLAALVDSGAVPNFEGSRRIALDDGHALYITAYGGEALVVASWLGAACVRNGVERVPCAFLEERVARELEGVKTMREAVAVIGDRRESLSLLTWEERGEENAALARAWLAAKG